MKKLIALVSLLLVVLFSYGQFGGGSGTETDPYRIYTKVHFDEFADSVIQGHNFLGEYLKLMNNIVDSISTPIQGIFNGNFNGQGNEIVLAINTSPYALFAELGQSSVLDSVLFSGYIYPISGIVNSNHGTISNIINNMTPVYIIEDFSQYVIAMNGSVDASGICLNNFGIIENCINKCDIHGIIIGGISVYNEGEILRCSNFGKLIMYNEQFECQAGGIAVSNTNLVNNCRNDADFLFIGNFPCYGVGGIIGNNSTGKIYNSQNLGNISGKVNELGGIVGSSWMGDVSNCSNYGNLSGQFLISGIGNFYSNCKVQNCFNSGQINGVSDLGGISGFIAEEDTITNCLNIGYLNGSAIIDSVYQWTVIVVSNNYYDKQMCLSKGISGVDVPNSAEGKLTTQLTGTSPALQAMLGDGWSYAEGRYPIPLGLENDSMALVAATPVYLHFENEEDYNHVDSVSRNFTVGLENNVSWDEANGRVNFNGENVTLLNIGMETLTVNLGDYSKQVRINILDTETSNIQETITEKGIIIYPNPASDYFNINLNGINADEMQICDITGKVITSQSFTIEQNQIHIGDLKPGMYLLKIYNKNQNVTTLRFVKN